MEHEPKIREIEEIKENEVPVEDKFLKRLRELEEGFFKISEKIHIVLDATKHIRDIQPENFDKGLFEYSTSWDRTVNLFVRTSLQGLSYPKMVETLSSDVKVQEAMVARSNILFEETMKSFRHEFWQTHGEDFDAFPVFTRGGFMSTPFSESPSPEMADHPMFHYPGHLDYQVVIKLTPRTIKVDVPELKNIKRLLK